MCQGFNAAAGNLKSSNFMNIMVYDASPYVPLVLKKLCTCYFFTGLFYNDVPQNVPPALLVRFLREHRSEWTDYGVDSYSAACLKSSPYAVPCARPGGFPSSQVILPLAPTVEHEEVFILTIHSSISCIHLIYAHL